MPSERLHSRVTRRRLGLSGASVLAVGPSRGTAQAITFAGYGDWFQAAFDATVLAPFRKSHPEIDVFYYPIGTSFQALTLLRTERLYPSLDVVLLESSVAGRATAEGLLDPLTLPVMKDLGPGAVLAKVAGPVLAWDSLVIGFNPGSVASPPRSWRDLWDIAYDRIALQTPPDPAALALSQVASTLFGGDFSPRSLDVGLTALTALIPRVALWNPRPDVFSAIAVGDAAIGPGWNGRARNQAALTPGRFTAIIPQDGSPVASLTVNLVKGSRQPEAARALIAYLLGPEAQLLLAETMSLAPANAMVDLPPATQAKVGATPAMVSARIAMDWDIMTGIRGQLATEWRRRNLGER